jgi:hypothetical protein
METILVLVALGLFLLYISLNKKDSTLLFFSGIFLSFCGLNMLNSLSVQYAYAFGVVIAFTGLYIMIRTAIEMIVGDEDNEIKSKGRIKLWQK